MNAETVAAAAPSSAEARVLGLVRRGREQLRLHDIHAYEEAVPLFREALELDAACAAAYAGLAETYAYWGFRREVAGQESESLYAMAREFAEMALRLGPARADAHRAMAVALRRGPGADPARRKQEAATAVDLDPTDAENWCEQWRVDGYDPDSPALKRALELGPGLCGLHIDLGAVYTELGRHEEALAELMNAMKLNAQNSLACYDMAMVLDRLGQRARARALLQRCLTLHPADSLLESGLELLEGRIP